MANMGGMFDERGLDTWLATETKLKQGVGLYLKGSDCKFLIDSDMRTVCVNESEAEVKRGRGRRGTRRLGGVREA